MNYEREHSIIGCFFPRHLNLVDLERVQIRKPPAEIVRRYALASSRHRKLKQLVLFKHVRIRVICDSEMFSLTEGLSIFANGETTEPSFHRLLDHRVDIVVDRTLTKTIGSCAGIPDAPTLIATVKAVAILAFIFASGQIPIPSQIDLT